MIRACKGRRVAGLLLLLSLPWLPANVAAQPGNPEAPVIAEKDILRVLGSPRFSAATSYFAMAMTPDDRQLITVSRDDEQAITVWDRETEKVIHRLPHRWAWHFALSADGTRLASAGDNDVRFWDLKSGKAIWSLRDDQHDTSTAIGCSPDGKLLAVYKKKKLEILDSATGRTLRTIDSERYIEDKLTFSPDSNLLVARDSKDRKVRLWNPRTGEIVRTLEEYFAPNVFVFTPDGKKLVGAGLGKSIHVWEVATGRLLMKIPGHTDNHASLAVSKDGRLLAVGGAIRQANVHRERRGMNFIWDLESFKLVNSFPGMTENSAGLCFTSDGRTLVSACSSIRSWDVETGREINPAACHQDLVTALAFSADGKTLMSAGFDATIRTWDLATREQRSVAPLPRDVHFDTVLLSPRSSAASAVLAKNAGVAVFDTSTGKERNRVKEASFKPFAFSALGKHLVLADEKRLVHWDHVAGRISKEIPHAEAGFELAATDPTGRFLVGRRSGLTSGPLSNGIYQTMLWDLHNNRCYHRGAPQTPYSPVSAFTPDGKTLFACEKDMALWEVASAKPRAVLGSGGHFDVPPVVSPDGRWAAMVGNRRMSVWNLLTLKCVFSSPESGGYGTRAAWSEDSRFLAASRGVQLVVWDFAKFVGPPAALKPLKVERFEQLWETLSSPSAEAAFLAVRELRQSEPVFVPWLLERLNAVPAPDLAAVDRLVRDLDSLRFQTRDKALRELERMPPSAAPRIAQAIAEASQIETRRRLDSVHAKLTGPLVQPNFLRVARSLEVLENHVAPQARQAFEGWTAAHPGWLASPELPRTKE